MVITIFITIIGVTFIFGFLFGKSIIMGKDMITENSDVMIFKERNNSTDIVNTAIERMVNSSDDEVLDNQIKGTGEMKRSKERNVRTEIIDNKRFSIKDDYYRIIQEGSRTTKKTAEKKNTTRKAETAVKKKTQNTAGKEVKKSNGKNISMLIFHKNQSSANASMLMLCSKQGNRNRHINKHLNSG